MAACRTGSEQRIWQLDHLFRNCRKALQPVCGSKTALYVGASQPGAGNSCKISAAVGKPLSDKVPQVTDPGPAADHGLLFSAVVEPLFHCHHRPTVAVCRRLMRPPLTTTGETE